MKRLTVLALALALAVSGCSWLVDRELVNKKGKATTEEGRGMDEAGIGGTDRDGGNDAAMPHDGAVDARVDDTSDGKVSSDGGMDPVAQRRALKLCVGAEHACVILPAGELRCWGRGLEGQLDLSTDARYKDIACGDYHTCGIDEQGALFCVGRNRESQRAEDAGPWTEVVASSSHTCALNDEGKVRCWGLDDRGQLQPPDVAFSAISAGEGFGCGIRASDAEITCWGDASLNLAGAPAGTKFSAIDSADSQTCAVTQAGGVVCWGHSHLTPPTLFGARRVSTARIGSCASLADDKVRCWHGQERRLPTDTFGDYVQVELGRTSWCLLPASGDLVCDSSQPEGVHDVPANLLEGLSST